MADPLIYVSHEIRPHPRSNAVRAASYLREFLERGHVAIAPYLMPITAGWEDDHDPEQRERALRRMEKIAARCDVVAHTGPRISEGMGREARACGREIDATGLDPAEAVAMVGNLIRADRRF